jgi:hypothetical protein
MKDFRETLRRSLEAADYLIRAASTENQVLRGRLTSMAQDLLGEAESATQNDSADSTDRSPLDEGVANRNCRADSARL